MIKGRQQYGQKERKPLTDEQRELMRRESRACMVVQFHNNPQEAKFWSKCHQRKHRNMSEAVNYLIWLVSEYKPWQGCVASAGIFDTRTVKSISGQNKIYQYEKGCWKLVDNPNF